MFSANDLRETLEALTPPASRGYLIALSGGADSCALLAAMMELRAALAGRAVRVIHVNHNLQPTAASFAERCARLCEHWQVPLTVLAPSLQLMRGRSVEEVAREARYDSLGAALHPEECLLTAHHQQDQAETFVLQALRGAGAKGLSAMPEVRRLLRGWHLRPLLRTTRSELRRYVTGLNIPVLQDAMNADARFDRAYLRHAVWPQLEARWPAAAEVLARAAAQVASVYRVVDQSVQRDLGACRDGDALSLPLLRRLPPSRQLEVLRSFVEAAGLRPPPNSRLREGLRQMLSARADKNPVLRWGEHALRRYRRRLYLTRAQIEPISLLAWDIRRSPVCELGAGRGRLVLRTEPGGLDPECLPEVLQIRPRRGGETLKMAADAPTHSVRHLFQERGVVPWMRDAIPFLYAGERLVAVADCWREFGPRGAQSVPGVVFEWADAPTIL